MELFRHELYKVFSRKTVWIGFLFITILVCFSSYMQASQLTKLYGNIREYYNDFYKGNEGPITDSLKQSVSNWMSKNASSYRLRFAEGKTSVLENRTIDFYDHVISSENFINSLQVDIDKLENNTNQMNNTYNARKNDLQISMLQNLHLSTPELYFTLPLLNDLSFPYELGFVVMGILVLLGVSPVFSEEYSSNMDSIILSSKKGRRSIVTAKILATTVYCISVAFIMLFVNFVVQAAVLGIQGLNAPVQFTAFVNSPYTLTFGGYLALQAGLCAIACAFFGMLVLLISEISSNVLIPFFVCGFLFASTAFINSLGTAVPKALSTFSDFSYTELMRVNGLFESFKPYNIISHPVLYLNIILILYVIITSIVICFNFLVFHYRQVR